MMVSSLSLVVSSLVCLCSLSWSTSLAVPLTLVLSCPPSHSSPSVSLTLNIGSCSLAPPSHDGSLSLTLPPSHPPPLSKGLSLTTLSPALSAPHMSMAHSWSTLVIPLTHVLSCPPSHSFSPTRMSQAVVCSPCASLSRPPPPLLSVFRCLCLSLPLSLSLSLKL